MLEEETFGRERTLLRLGQKFHPIKKYAIDLDEMTDANKKKYGYETEPATPVKRGKRG